MHHFARGFKQSAGITPHHYLTQKRVERAQDMLAQTDLSLSEIAFAVGFSDQSHMARQFRQFIGITPSSFVGRSASNRTMNAATVSAASRSCSRNADTFV